MVADRLGTPRENKGNVFILSNNSPRQTPAQEGSAPGAALVGCAEAASYRSMSQDPLAKLAEQQTWTAPIEEPIQRAVRDAFARLGPSGHTVRNVLHGTWLHEPLHVVITDVPIGSWTATVVFDAIAALSGSKAMNTAADATLILGLVGAAGAAVTGLNDWADTTGAPKRIGAVHGILNVAVVGLFGVSWALRRRKTASRTAPRVLAALGYGVLSVSAHLGGNLIYEHGVGVQDTKPLD